LVPKNEKEKDWHREVVGGLWDEIGKLQFDFLVKEGMKPENYLLDVGCGSLRGGIHAIRYLNEGHYFGIDKDEELLYAGNEIELKRYNLNKKNPILVPMADFDFIRLGQQFDYAMAQSVFTHLPKEDIIRCLFNIEKVLVKGGKFYATFFEKPATKLNSGPIPHKRVDGPDIITFDDRDPFHYLFHTFEQICTKNNLKVKYIGDWNHPRNQKIIVFIK